jgi:spoIIIJ-associated protein
MGYEPKLAAHEFVGASRGEAVAKACAFFGASEAELSIVELGPSEVSGLADRVLVVAAMAAARAERSPRRERSERPERGERRDRPERDRPERFARAERTRVREAEPPRERRAAREPEAIEGESVATVRGELGEIGQFVRGLVERMDLGPFEVSESLDGAFHVVSLTGPAARRLRATEGRAAEGIQLLANQFAMRSGDTDQRVVVDVEGDVAERESFLERVAERAAARARESGRAVALEPMNGRDRRSIHVALRGLDDIATMSIGEGRYRQVVVVPRGAPEFEEARRQERMASSD